MKAKKAEKKGINLHAKPRIERVVVNAGVGKQRDNKALMEAVRADLAKITGQMPHERRARKAIAGFGVRAGNLTGYRVTLHGKRKDDFVQRMVKVVLPRVRDFRGIKPSAMDGRGNLNIGIEEHLAFPEIDPDKTDATFGLQVNIVTTAKTKEEGTILFKELGFPLAEEGNQDGDLT